MTLKIEFVTYADREDWVVEIWGESELVAEITKEEPGSPIIEFYASKGANSCRVNLDDLRKVLDEAIGEAVFRWRN